jgi:NAD-dependent DNA ligase
MKLLLILLEKLNHVAVVNMNLRQLELQEQKRKEEQLKLYDIKGKTILLTGRIPKFTRTIVEKKIAKLGGYLTDEPSRHVDIVVFTRTNTSKYQRSMEIERNSFSSIMRFVMGEDFVKNYLNL